MRVGRFLHTLFGNTIHKKRISVLSEAVVAALNAKEITLTGLGRSIQNNCQERSNIRKIDRLFCNKKLLNESVNIYQIVSNVLLQGIVQPVIIVDAVKLPHSDMYALRASCTVGGRCHTLYELLFPKSKEGHIDVHTEFLYKLKEVLPKKCNPIIVTDAGFHNTWFKLVLSLGWHFIGRIRGLKIYRSLESKTYNPCSSLWKDAKNKAELIGQFILNRKNPLSCFFYRYKNKLKGRITKETKDNALLHYARSVREPWVLASSLGHSYKPHQIIKMYQKRMKIEESFRDMKSSRYGLGLEKVRTQKLERYTVILLIAMLTNFIACLIGQAVELKNQHYKFQANSIKHRRVLSYFYLGCQAFRKKIKVTIQDMAMAWDAARIEFGVPR